MPASASSPIAVLTAHAGPAGAEPNADLLTALGEVPDPRKARGRRHRLVTVLALSVAAVLAGARSYVAIAEWAHDLPVSARVRLGIGRRAPSESTIRRILQAVDLDALDAALSGWVAARLPTPLPSRPITRVIAVDGKTARGARRVDGPATHLLAAFDHTSGVVLGQTEVNGKSNEITAFGPLLDRIDLTDVLITADALHTQRGHAEYLHQRGGHYLWIVKPNQPRPHTQLLELPWRQVPVAHEHRDRGHGRVEHRQLKLTPIEAGIGFPHARLAIQLQRRRRPIASTSWSSETIYAVTDLTWRQAPAKLIAEVIRGHWQIEALHWIRDVSFGEDLSPIRTGHGPANMATLRNFAVSRHRLAGATQIAQACRHTARHPNRALALLT
ncbi:MAG: ISAs1 family transposase [Actinobacteria bacterium]|nr:ISAs1 family transposase [Actinomycetota bacterium]